jgi:hypothetical protein
MMSDEALQRLLDYNRRRFWLENGWSIRFRIAASPVTMGRPNGIKYSFTLHDTDGTRLLGFDNAHGVSRVTAFDHRHRFRRTQDLVPYDFIGADELICDFFDALEQACRQEGVAFEFVEEDIELEYDDEADESV